MNQMREILSNNSTEKGKHYGKWTQQLKYLKKTVCISHGTNTFENGMNSIILHPANGTE